ncbi:MAG: D-2-hydroxyacid dehydrogenase [Pirellulales bacterium]|nr:D-2-hydroxyacid dehydrogenase [Pirellulales bacterium]
MQITILDGYTLNPGDLSWAELEKLGDCTIYERTPNDEIVDRAAHAQVVLTNKTPLARETLARLPHLKYIGVLATGYNIVDVAAARERGIAVANVPGYASQSVAQSVFAHLLNLALHVAQHGQSVSAGKWSKCEDFCFWDYPLVELSGLTLGIVGFGQIGRAVANVALAFGMKVIACDTAVSAPPPNVRMVALEELFRQSDVVSLHCPLTPQTERLVNARRLSWMKPTAYLINTSRGPLVDEKALADALAAGRLAGAGLDVLSVEPPPADHPLLGVKNCCLTPHIAWATAGARKRLLDAAVENVRAFLAGMPQNVVN